MRMPRTMSLIFVMGAMGCGPHPSSTPTVSSPSPVPAPSSPSHLNLNGDVHDTAFRSVSGATVKILDGAQAGASTQSDETGRFSFVGRFEDPTAVRVSKEGYTAATGTAKSMNSSNGTMWASVVLDALAKPVDIAGDYALTIVANGACAGMPDDLRTRTYAASIRPTPDSGNQPGTSLRLTVGGGSLLPDRNSFPIVVAGNWVSFIMYNDYDFALVEKIAPGSFLAVQGGAAVSMDDGPLARISTPFSGVIDYCALQSDTGWTDECNSGPRTAYQSCQSKQHELILSRR
jgi:hypothetical protein